VLGLARPIEHNGGLGRRERIPAEFGDGSAKTPDKVV
jgi:hypothetical protein